MISIFHLFKELAAQLRGENLHRVVLGLISLIVIGGLLFWMFEADVSLVDSIWWAFVTVTTVGYGDFFPMSVGGRITGVVLMMVGIGFIGILTAAIAGFFIENKLLESRGMKAANVKNHFVIIDWNYSGPDIVAELRADAKANDVDIVILAQREESPISDKGVHFIRGEVNADNLARASAGQAQALILLADEQVDPQLQDARTILDTLAIKKLYPDVYVCVQLMETKNASHCELAGADEIVIVGELSSGLLAQAALDHGMSHLVTELISNRYGNELYKIDPTADMIGRKFVDIVFELKRDRDILCLGVENRRDFTLTANPQAGYQIGPEDQLVVIASERPSLG